jgi:hypothetical protein
MKLPARLIMIAMISTAIVVPSHSLSAEQAPSTWMAFGEIQTVYLLPEAIFVLIPR